MSSSKFLNPSATKDDTDIERKKKNIYKKDNDKVIIIKTLNLITNFKIYFHDDIQYTFRV